jgi:glucose-1-phosphate thymidylyltransferase
MKGIVLAGGAGTRLYPITRGTSKQLLPVYDKPMIYYPLSVLMLSGIREILIISTAEDLPNFERLLGSGEDFGISLSYKVQPSPDGLAQAFIIGEEFIEDDDVCMVLGDNIFNGHGFSELLLKAVSNVKNQGKATVFGYYMRDAKRYGVVELNSSGGVVSIEEKPNNPKGNHAVVGLYYYPNSVVDIAKKVTPSKRGELEITSINNEYLKRGELQVEIMGRGFTWLDTGTHDSLIEASNYIKTVEARQGLKVACLEVIACQMGYISKKQLLDLARRPLGNSGYGKYLIQRSKEF